MRAGKRFLAALLSVTLSLGLLVYETPKAEAVEGVDDAVFGSMALASYMTATGVPLTVIEGGAGAVSAGLSSVAGSYAAATGAAASGEAVLGTIAAGTAISTAGTIILTAAAVAACAALVAWLISEKGVTEGGDAVEVVKSTGGFTATSCSTSYSGRTILTSISNKTEAGWLCCESLIYSLGVNSKVAILEMSEDRFGGYYFDNIGAFRYGLFENPYGAVNASFFGVYDLADLVYMGSTLPCVCYYSSPSLTTYVKPIFYDRSYARNWSDFLLSGCFAFDHSTHWFIRTSWGSPYPSIVFL